MRPLLVVPLLVAGCLRAQQVSAAGVTLDQTEKPLAGVHVRLITGEFDSGDGVDAVYGAISDKAGQFSFESVKPGLYLVMAERSGYLQQSANGFTMLALKPGQHLADYKIVMTAQAAIAGRVTDEYGDPVQGVPVQTQAAVSKQPQNFMFGGRNVMTDDRGEFRLTTAPGKYYVKAAQFNPQSGPLETRTDGTAGGPFIGTYFPNAANTEAASVVEVTAGQEVAGVEIRMLRSGPAGGPAHALTVSGMVIGTPDSGRANVMLRFGDKPGEVYNGRGAATGEDGKFLFTGLQPGYYSVVASYSQGKTSLHSHALEFHLEADQTGLQLTLAPSEELIGKLELVGDATAGQAEKHTVRLEAAGWGNNFGEAEPAAAEVGQDGSFRIGGITPSKLKPVVEPMPENGYLKEVALDGKAVPDGVLDFSQGVGGSRLKLTVSRNGGQISGKILGKDGEPAIGLIMVFIGTDPKHMDENNASRTSDAKYSLKAIRPGKYRLLAVDVAEMMQAFIGDGNEEESMQRLFDAAEEIEIKEGDRISKDLTALTKMPEKKEAR